jgi:hypothetical protein
VKESLCRICKQESEYISTSCRLPKNSHVIRVAPELLNVRFNPFKGMYLIEDPKIPGGLEGIVRQSAQGRMRKPTEGTQSVLQAHDDHILRTC